MRTLNSQSVKQERSRALKLLGGVAVSLSLATAFTLSGCDETSNPPTGGNGGADTTTAVFRSSDFSSAEECKGCHPDQYNEWSGSMHAYAAKDPVFMALNDLGRNSYINAVDQGCVKCHTVIGSRAGEAPWGEPGLDNLSPVAQEGVTCDVCHTITSVRAIQNSEIILSPGDVRYGSFRGAVKNDFHISEYHPLYETSEYCGSCHDIVTDGKLELETTFREWRDGGHALTGKSCNDCHMPTYTGEAAVGGPLRTLHRHTFVGTDLAFIDFPNKPEQLQLVTDLLKSALTMTANVPASANAGQRFEFSVDMTNDKTGHNVPSGATFLRQMWLSVIVRNSADSILYSSGQLDANNDLMDKYSAFPERDPDLYNAQSTMLRADSTETGLSWEAAFLIDPTIRPGQTTSATYGFDIAAGQTGPLTVDIRLRYRSFPPHVVRFLNLNSLLPITIIDMNETIKIVTLN